MLDYCRDFNREAVEEIHNALINGQRKEMVKRIDLYGLYDFWFDYEQYLGETAPNLSTMYMWFADTVISYHRIKAR